MNKLIAKYADRQTVFFIVKFLLLLGLFYLLTYGFIGVSTPGNVYWPWLDEHFNYVKVFRTFLLKSAKHFISIFGYDSTVSLYRLHVINGTTIRIVYTCLGLGIISFWWAFVLSFPQSRAAKTKYMIFGTLFIIVINILRISVLAILYTKFSGTAYRDIDHHMIFDICVYGVLCFMIYKWLNHPYSTKDNNKKAHPTNEER